MNNTGRQYGAQDMVSPLRRVIVHAPAANMAADPALWHYGTGLSQEVLVAQHNEFIAHLAAAGGAEIIRMREVPDTLCDAVFAHDPSLVSDAGAILLRMGKHLRRAEVDVHNQLYEKLGVPILGRIEAPGTIEAGDCLWLNPQTLIVGRSFRTNAAGIEQLTALLEPRGVTVHPFDLPMYSGEDACLHLMSSCG